MTTCTATTRMTLSPYQPEHPSVACFRDVDADGRHRGEHQGIDHIPANPGDPSAPFPPAREPRPAFDRLVTWSNGAQSQTYDPAVPNTNCMCVRAAARGDQHQLRILRHTPADHRWATCSGCGVIFDAKRPDPVSCSTCSYWQERIRLYGSTGPKGERFVRAHDDRLSAGEGAWLYVWSPGHGGAFGGRQFTVTWDDGTSVGPADYLWSNGRIPWWFVDHFPPNGTIVAAGQEIRPGHTSRLGTPLTYTAHPEVPR